MALRKIIIQVANDLMTTSFVNEHLATCGSAKNNYYNGDVMFRLYSYMQSLKFLENWTTKLVVAAPMAPTFLNSALLCLLHQLLADPSNTRVCSTNTIVIDSLS